MRHRKGFGVIVILLFIVPFGTASASGASVVLVTGFEPFGSYTENPSQLIAETLNGTTLFNAEVIGIVLPVDFNASVEKTQESIELYHPDLVLCLGLDGRSKTIEVEKIGVNLQRYQKDDGTWSFPRRIDTNGPFFLLTTLPTADITRTIRQAHIPVRQSFFAGMYVCNTLLYQIMGYLSKQQGNTSAGFIHVPLLDSQDPHGMPLGTMVDAVKLAIQISLEEKNL
jgi:pyroglutamyl-peptidase